MENVRNQKNEVGFVREEEEEDLLMVEWSVLEGKGMEEFGGV